MSNPQPSSTVGSAFNLRRFLDAQQDSYSQALKELTTGKKQSHWMWFIFPQFAGLGLSQTSMFYAIGSLDEARAYINHPILGARLRECAWAVNNLQNSTAHDIFGSPDDMKFFSSMTLFELAADSPSEFTTTLEKYFPGKRDEVTIRLVNLHSSLNT